MLPRRLRWRRALGSGLGSAAMSQEPRPEAETESALHCDFCGAEAEQVRRIALDAGYERLQTPHPVRYACPACSERKEAERRARPSGAA